MEFQTHRLSVQRTARVVQLGSVSDASEHWLIFHGYGQLSAYFLKHFEDLRSGRCFWAPEALNRFYLEGLSGRVGAGWMTKEARLDDISDNMFYIDTVINQIIRPQMTYGKKLHILAFSQGVATACRWIEIRRPLLDKLILWAGMLPQDISTDGLKEILKQHRTTVVYGKNDPYLSDENLKSVSEFMIREAPEVEIRSYDGGHHFDKTLLSELITRI